MKSQFTIIFQRFLLLIVFSCSLLPANGQKEKPSKLIDRQVKEFYNGNYKAVIEIGKQVIEISESRNVFMEENRLLVSYTNIALSYQNIGLIDSALVYFNKMMESIPSVHGLKEEDKYDYFLRYGQEIQWFANLKYELGQYSEAIELLDPLFGNSTLAYFDSVHVNPYESVYSLDYDYSNVRNDEYEYLKSYFDNILEYNLFASVNNTDKKSEKLWKSSIISNADLMISSLSLYTQCKVANYERESASKSLKLAFLLYENFKYAVEEEFSNEDEKFELLNHSQFDLLNTLLDYRIAFGISPNTLEPVAFYSEVATEVLKKQEKIISIHHKPLFNLITRLIEYYLQWDQTEGACELLSKYLPQYELVNDSYLARLYFLDALRLGNSLYEVLEYDQNYPNLIRLSGNRLEKFEIFNERMRESFELYLSYYEKNRYALSFEEQRQYWKNVESRIQVYYDKIRSEYLVHGYEKGSNIETECLEKILEVRAMTKGKSLNNALRLKRQIYESTDELVKNQYQDLLTIKGEYSSSLVSQKSDNKYLDSLRLEIRKQELQLMKKLDPQVQNNYFDISVIQNSLKEKDAYIEIIKLNVIHTDRSFKWAQYTNMSDGGLKLVKNEYNYSTDNVNSYFVVIVKDKSIHYNIIEGENLEGKSLKYYQNMMRFKSEDSLSYKAFFQPIFMGKKLEMKLGKNVPDGRGGEKYTIYTHEYDEQPLKDIENIYYSPDGVYNLINPSTLFDAEREIFLLGKYNFKLINSPRYFFENKKPVQLTNKEVVLFGDPAFNSDNASNESSLNDNERAILDFFGGNISQLPATKKEVSTITDLLKDNYEVITYTQESANEGNLRKVNQPNILHIATHGYFLDDETNSSLNQMSSSGLLFSGVLEGENHLSDGIFTSQEASALNLAGTSLVVLSACQSGLGAVQNGEGVYGLQRGLTIAGANNLIISLWPISDEVTAEWMKALYQKIAEGKAINKAFQETMNEVRGNYPHPYYWGPFVMLMNN